MRTIEIYLAVYEGLIRQAERLEILKRLADEDGYIQSHLIRKVLNISEDRLDETGGVKADGETTD